MIEDKWVDRYIPQNVDDLILNGISKKKLSQALKSGKRFNVTFHGRPGIGKTSSSNVISKELNAIEQFVSCSLDGKIDNIKTTLSLFCEGISIDGRPKLVVLDEIDGMSLAAQKSLRNLIDNNKDTMFILTCNYINRVIPALQDRCPPVSLQFSTDDIVPRLKKIMESEGIEYTRDNLDIFIEKIIPRFMPSVRSIITVLQDCCSSGSLDPDTEIALLDGIDEICREIFNRLKSGESPVKVREYIIHNSEKFDDDYVILSSKVFNVLCKLNTSAESLSKMANIIYRIDQVIDKEIQFFVLISYIHALINRNK